MAEYDYDAIRAALRLVIADLRCAACKSDALLGSGGDVVLSLPVRDKETKNGKSLDHIGEPSVDRRRSRHD